MPQFFRDMDQPTIDGLNTWLVARQASAAGLKVVFSGIGGDELFAGYPSFRDIPRWLTASRLASRWFHRVPGLRWAAMNGLEAGIGHFGIHPKARLLANLGDSVHSAYDARRGLFTADEIAQLMTADAWRDANENDHPLNDGITGDGITGDDELAVGALESTRYLRNQLLRDADWAGMAHSVEIRTPLVDHILLETVLRARGHHRACPGKAELVRSPQRPMPPEIARRRKTGFTVPLSQWLDLKPNRARSEPLCPRWLSAHWSRMWALRVLEHAFPEAAELIRPQWRDTLDRHFPSGQSLVPDSPGAAG